jgi:hypothetical protein
MILLNNRIWDKQLQLKNNLIMRKEIEYKGEIVSIVSEINDKIIIRYKGKLFLLIGQK